MTENISPVPAQGPSPEEFAHLSPSMMLTPTKLEHTDPEEYADMALVHLRAPRSLILEIRKDEEKWKKYRAVANPLMVHMQTSRNQESLEGASLIRRIEQNIDNGHLSPERLASLRATREQEMEDVVKYLREEQRLDDKLLSSKKPNDATLKFLEESFGLEKDLIDELDSLEEDLFDAFDDEEMGRRKLFRGGDIMKPKTEYFIKKIEPRIEQLLQVIPDPADYDSLTPKARNYLMYLRRRIERCKRFAVSIEEIDYKLFAYARRKFGKDGIDLMNTDDKIRKSAFAAAAAFYAAIVTVPTLLNIVQMKNVTGEQVVLSGVSLGLAAYTVGAFPDMNPKVAEQHVRTNKLVYGYALPAIRKMKDGEAEEVIDDFSERFVEETELSEEAEAAYEELQERIGDPDRGVDNELLSQLCEGDTESSLYKILVQIEDMQIREDFLRACVEADLGKKGNFEGLIASIAYAEKLSHDGKYIAGMG